jgi:hypothetical protein
LLKNKLRSGTHSRSPVPLPYGRFQPAAPPPSIGIRDDKDFAAALSQWRQRTHESARNKLISAADGAANVLLNRLRHGDLRAAIAILRSNGLLTPDSPDSREQTDKSAE